MNGRGSPFGPIALIGRRDEDRGRVARAAPAAVDALAERGLAGRVVLTDSLDGAEAAARRELEGGRRFLVALGGDATVHAIVNGMFADGLPVRDDAVLGLLPAGAINDVAKTFGLPADTPRAVGFLSGERVFEADLVLATFGERPPRVLVNIAQAGLGGTATRRAERLPRWLGRGRTFVGFWSAVAGFRPVAATLAGDRRNWEGRVHEVIVANGQYLHDGMRLSPKSWPDDGFFEVLVMTGPKSDSFTIIPKTYLGEHLPHPNIVEYRSRTLRIQTERPVDVHLDGVVEGRTPVGFRLVPKALRLKT